MAADHIDQKQATLDADKYTVRKLLAAARAKVRVAKSDDKPARLLSLGRFAEWTLLALVPSWSCLAFPMLE